MPRVALLIPCYNEAQTIGKVVRDFRRALPETPIHVFDNASSDGTAELAIQAGAHVHFVAMRGKGSVVRAMFREVDADVLVMVDGDDTYLADRVQELVAPVAAGQADMVVATRLHDHTDQSFRRYHVFGNNLVRGCINWLFDARLQDVLSGYRAFSRRFVKCMPVLSRGFEIETEITLHALEHGLAVTEIPMPYGERPDGSHSKLNTFRDGFRVLSTIFRIFKDYRPLPFFGVIGAVIFGIGLFIGVVVVEEFATKGQVVGLARAALSVGLCLTGLLSITTGLVLDTVNRRARELYLIVADQLIGK